jgi:predicted metal-dependent enzyme (double-stranded beta helix superfamily)
MDLDGFITDLRCARRSHDLSSARELMAEAIRQKPLAAEVGDPCSSQILHCEPGLLVLHGVLLSDYVTAPHDHGTWSLVGVYQGQEDNVFFQRLPQSQQIEQIGGRRLGEGEILLLGPDAIHSITNPRHETLMTLHVYGANIFAIERSAWDPETFEEEPFDFARHAGGPKVK